MIFKKTILFIFAVMLVQVIQAQGRTTIKASVSKNKILLGEPLVLTIEANILSASKANFIQLDSIPHFELLKKALIDSVVKDGSLIIKGVYTITSFDSGRWVIPSFILANGVNTESISIDAVFSDFDPEQDYHDIKDVIDVYVLKKKNAWWIYIVGSVGVVLIIYLLLKRKKQPVLIESSKKSVTPFDEAMNELGKLQLDKPISKEYYSKLINIFRLYIFKKKGILSLQKTTDDLVIQLEKLNLDKVQFVNLSQSLRLSDFVKFAKYETTNDDDNSSYETIKNTITIVEQSD